MKKKDFNACVKDAHATGYKKGYVEALLKTSDELLAAGVELWKYCNPLLEIEKNDDDIARILRSFAQSIRKDAMTGKKIQVPEE